MNGGAVSGITSSLIAIAVAVTFAPQIHGQEEASANARLKQAGALLESLQVKRPLTTEDKSENEKTAEELANLRQQFTHLVSAYQSGRKTSDLESDWKVRFSDVERTLARLIGGGSQVPTMKVGTAVVAGAVGTAGNIEPAPTDAVGNASPGNVANSPVGTAGNVPAGTVAAAQAGAPTGASPAAETPATQAPVSTPTAAAGAVSPADPAQNQLAGDNDPAAPLVGIAAAKVSTIGVRDLDPAIRSLLEKFRVELELFYTAP